MTVLDHPLARWFKKQILQTPTKVQGSLKCVPGESERRTHCHIITSGILSFVWNTTDLCSVETGGLVFSSWTCFSCSRKKWWFTNQAALELQLHTFWSVTEYKTTEAAILSVANLAKRISLREWRTILCHYISWKSMTLIKWVQCHYGTGTNTKSHAVRE